MASRPKFVVERTKIQNDLLKELVSRQTECPETSPQFKKCHSAALKSLPNNKYLSINSNDVQRCVVQLYLKKLKMAFSLQICV